MRDLIERQVAIAALEHNIWDPLVLHDAIATIRELPTAISLPEEHGRLIDGDELASGCDEPYWCRWFSEIEDAPTIVPAERRVKNG